MMAMFLVGGGFARSRESQLLRNTGSTVCGPLPTFSREDEASPVPDIRRRSLHLRTACGIPTAFRTTPIVGYRTEIISSKAM